MRRIGAPAPRRPGGARPGGGPDREHAARPVPPLGAWVVEGLADDNVALVAKVHHCGVDGSAGAQFMVHLFDLESMPPAPGPTPIEPGPSPPTASSLQHAAASRMRQRLNIVPLLGKTISSATSSSPRATAPTGRRVPSRSPPRPRRGTARSQPKRNVAFSRVPLADMKAIKARTDATVNDVVLAICAGTLRRYLESRTPSPIALLAVTAPWRWRPTKTGPQLGVGHVHLARLRHRRPALRLAVISENTKGARDHNAIGADMLRVGPVPAPNTFALAARLYSSMNLADRHPAHPQPRHLRALPGPPFPSTSPAPSSRPPTHGPGDGGRA